jgi:sRNA-binding regulator protein Hfq
LAGVATKYAPIELQARFLMPRTKKPTMATVTLASGKRVTGTLQLVNNYEVIRVSGDA